jgi:dsDNA-binding SOS-regulon protein
MKQEKNFASTELHLQKKEQMSIILANQKNALAAVL